MTQQNKRRKKRYQPGSAYAGDVKPTGVLRVFGNVRLFFIVGALIMIGGLAIGGICSLDPADTTSNTGDDFVVPGDDDGTGTPDSRTPVEVKQYTNAPQLTIDTSKTYTATISTAEGDMVVELLASEVPETVNNFVFLARDGFYNGLTFHVVNEGFNIQAGDPNCQADEPESLCRGTGGPGYDFAQEDPGAFQTGQLGMVNGSQFFIALDASAQFDEFTPFGTVTSGLDIAERIAQGTAITSIEISES
jgi:cyclophilin family peptidyl-prolyl cis-trans isomerase